MRRIDGVPRPNFVVRRVRAQLEVPEVPLAQRRLGLDVRIHCCRDFLGRLERAAEIGREDGDGPFSHNVPERVARRARLLPARRMKTVLEPRAAVDAAHDDARVVRFGPAVPQRVVLVAQRELSWRQEQVVPL